MTAAVRHVTDASFEAEVLQAPGPVIVDFWASWCGPCRQIAPILEEIAREMEGRLIIGKVDMDQNPATRTACNVKAIPTLVVFRNGVEETRMTGAVSKTRLAAFIADIAERPPS